MSVGHFSPQGFYLAMDTSGPTGHVAVSRGGDVLARERLERRGQHASLLVPTLHRALEEAGVEVDELSGLVVGEGPGSFTGVRVAAATAKGLAHARGLPLWAVPSLAAAALGDLGRGGPQVRCILFDARADRVYAACYAVGDRGLRTILAPHASDLGTLLDESLPAGTLFAGDGAQRHAAVLEAAGHAVLPPPVGEPTADALVYYLTLHPETPPVATLETWEPRYVKASSAEREWTV